MNYENELKTLKEKYKTVYTVEVFLDDEETEKATIFLKKPDRDFYSMVSKIAQKGDMFRTIEAGLKYLYIGGDELSKVLECDDALISCESVILELLKKKEAVLKKN